MICHIFLSLKLLGCIITRELTPLISHAFMYIYIYIYIFLPCESTAGSNESRGASQRTISPASFGCQRSSGDCSYVPGKIKTKMLSDGLRASLSVLISWTFSRALVQYFCADFLDDLFSNSVGKAFGKVSGFVWDMLRPNNIHVPGKLPFSFGGGWGGPFFESVLSEAKC